MYFVTSQRLFIGTQAERSGLTPETNQTGISFFEVDTENTYIAVSGAWKLLGGGISSSGLSTGLLSGGTLAIATNPAQFNVVAGSGYIVDNTNPLMPVVETVTWSLQANNTLTNLATKEITYIFIETGGSLVQQDTLSPDDLRDKILLGMVYHQNHTSIYEVISLPIPALNGRMDTADLPNYRVSVDYTTSTDLEIDKSAAEIYRVGINFHTDENNPNRVNRAAQASETIHYMYRDGSGGWTFALNQSEVDPDNYDDDSGTLATVSSSNWSTQLLCYHIPSGHTYIYYGQDVHSDLETAIASLTLEVHDVFHPEFLPLYWIVAPGTVTNLSSPRVVIVKIVGDTPALYMNKGDNVVFADMHFTNDQTPNTPLVTVDAISSPSQQFRVVSNIVDTRILFDDFKEVYFDIAQSGGLFVVRDANTSDIKFQIDIDDDEVSIPATNIGFFNATPTTVQTITGSTGGNVALQNLLVGLENLGLIIDSTT